MTQNIPVENVLLEYFQAVKALATPLVEFFNNPDKQRLALKNVADHDIFVAKETEIYNWTWEAFYSDLPIESRRRHFGRIYRELSTRWQVFRSNRSDVEYWTPNKCFDAISVNFADWRMDGPIHLMNFAEARPEHHRALEVALGSIRDIKKNKEYPWMTASKFLHFFNPSLFPIYDNEYINKLVFRSFDSDYRSFCRTHGIDIARSLHDTTETFLVDYMRWAGCLLNQAHPRFMAVFCDWLSRTSGLESGRIDPQRLYARAFEYVAVGAAVAAGKYSGAG